MPWELRVGDIVPYDDGCGRPIVDIHAVGQGHRARCLVFADLPPCTVRQSLRVYRAFQPSLTRSQITASVSAR
jgi:hypothetical protein